MGATSYTIYSPWGRGMKVTRNLKKILLTYLRSVLIFIKQYTDSMSFSSIFSWKLRIIPYLCEIDVRIPTSFWSSLKFNNFEYSVKTYINCSRMQILGFSPPIGKSISQNNKRHSITTNFQAHALYQVEITRKWYQLRYVHPAGVSVQRKNLWFLRWTLTPAGWT